MPGYRIVPLCCALTALLAVNPDCAGAARGADPPPPASTAADGSPDPLDAAMREFGRSIEAARDFIEHHPSYADPRNRAQAMAFLSSMIVRSIEADVNQDPDFPYFRVIDPRIREGGDNPDQRYLASPLRGGERYRIWGHRGQVRRLDFQIYAGAPWSPGGGSVVAGLNSEELKCAADGSFEITISPDRVPGNWLRTAPNATSLLVRQTYSDWARENGGDVHIDRVGLEGAQKPLRSPEEMAARLNAAAASLRAVTRTWPEFVRTRYLERQPSNSLSTPASAVAAGGMNGRLYSSGHFDLADDEALLITTWPAPGDYQGIQLTDLWFSSLEYANRQSSLSLDQAYRSADGAYRWVVSARDPGVQNWLDTTGLREGVMLMRFDGLGDRVLTPAQYPATEVIRLADLWKHLPAGTPQFTADMRRESLAARRRHVQVRFND